MRFAVSDTGATSAASFRRPRSASLPAGATRWTRPGLPDGLAPCRADPGHARKPPRPVPVHTALVTRITKSCAGQACAAPARLYRRCMLYSRTSPRFYVCGVQYTGALPRLLNFSVLDSETRAQARVHAPRSHTTPTVGPGSTAPHAPPLRIPQILS